MATDGQLNFSTGMDLSGVERGLNELLAELKKISAAITAVPDVKVEVDKSKAAEAKEAVDKVGKATEEAGKKAAESAENADKKINNTGNEAKKKAAETAKAVKSASNSSSKAVGGSCDDILKSLSSTLGKVKALIAASGIAVAIKQLKTFLDTSETYFKTQFTAEKKLEQIMHNVAGATEEQVQATKDWAAELQKVGVIGDEVTLSGLQELGKYVNNADSLKPLSAALDDLIAQEHGLNATAENAASTAAMLGKVLNGQTTLLRRNGIIFDEAQENVLKYGTEQQRVAVLAQVVESRVGGMNAALANTPAGRLQQLSNTFGDIKEKFGEAYVNLKSLLVPVLNQVAGVLAQVAEYAVQATQALGDIFGISLDNSLAYKNNIMSAVDAQEDLTSAVEDTEKAQKGSIAAFDKLNTISSDKSEDKAASATTAAVSPSVNTKDSENKISKFAKKVKDTFAKLRAWLTDNFGETFKGIWNGLKEEGTELWGTLKRIFGDIKALGGPLLDYFNTYFVPFLQTTFGVIGNILTGLFDTFNKVFADIWDIVIFPYLQTYITVGLPMLTEFATEAVKTFGVYFDEVKAIFDMLWEDAAKPVLKFIMKLWQDLMESLKKFWDRYGNPIFEKFRTAIQKTSDIYMSAWNSYFKPLFDKLMANIDTLWQEHLKPLVDAILEYVGELITAALDIYNECIAPIVKWVVEVFGPPIMRTIGQIMETMFALLKNVADVAKGIIEALTGIVQFAAGVFTGDWERAWEGVKKIFKGVFDSLVGIVKVPLNLIIGNINLLLNGIEEMVNAIIAALGVVDFDIPSWVPGIGGKSFHLDLDSVDIPRIPYLAQGTVVPANYGNFLAMLGDNKREAEVVSPVSTMKQAMLEALAESGGAGPKELVVYTYLYPNSAAYHREVINIVNADARNKGG